MVAPLLLAPRALALALVVAAAALPGAARAAELERPVATDLADGAAFAHGELSASELWAAESEAPFWGGHYTTAAGEPVTLWFSPTYVQDAARAQAWADYLGRLVHGPELAAVSVYVLPLDEVQGVCGRQALACFGRSIIVTPGADPEPAISAESVLAHEYGHHVAASRLNTPWVALDWGTKRWASYEQICRETRAGRLFPGDESGRYSRNPGEGFAEAYRVLNERRAGVPESPWEIVSTFFYPDALALARLEADVVSPWSGNASTVVTARVGPSVRIRAHTVATRLDGALRVSLRVPRGLSARLQLLTPSGREVGRTLVSGGTTRALRTTVCGSRAYRVRVTRLAGAGTYRLVTSRP